MDSQIKAELAVALERLGAHPYLIATVNSWGDSLPDSEVLRMLKAWNAGDLEIDLFASSGDVPPA